LSKAIEKSGKSKTNLVDENFVSDGEQDPNNDNWIPNTAYNLAHSFRARHGDELSFDLVNEMLRDLNRIYRDREKKQIARFKA